MALHSSFIRHTSQRTDLVGQHGEWMPFWPQNADSLGLIIPAIGSKRLLQGRPRSSSIQDQAVPRRDAMFPCLRYPGTESVGGLY